MKFKLRAWNLNDIENLVKYANNYNIAKNLTNQFPHPYTRENGIAFITMAAKEKPLNIFAIEINGRASGGIGLYPKEDIYCKNAELGYWLAEPYWSKGIITNAIKQVVTYGFMTFDIDRIFARPFGTNIGSQRALEKAGFILEGKFDKIIYKKGEYLDELIYAIRKKE